MRRAATTVIQGIKCGVIHPRGGPHRGTMLFMHGLGDTFHGFQETFEELGMALNGIKIILPQAPDQAVTLNQGYVMPSWYDIEGLDSRAEETCKGIDESREKIIQIINEEMKNSGFGLEDIVLGGFSQGAALSIYTALGLPKPVKGVIMLSGYLPFCDKIEVKRDVKTPVLICHGESDQVVKFSWAQDAHAKIKESFGDENVEFKKYQYLEHEVSTPEIQHVVQWINQRYNQD